MITFSKISRGSAFLAFLFYTFCTVSYADTLSGKIVSIRPLQSGRSEVILSQGTQRDTITLNSSTEVESVVPAAKLQEGSMIYLPLPSAGGSRGGGRKGLKSPFRGIPKGMQKSMGLPNMPETPDVPGQPEAAAVPKIPKVPKVPKAPKKEDAQEAAAEDQEPGKAKRTVQPAAVEPTEAEKNLYGKVSADKPLLPKTGAPSQKMTPKKIVSIKTVKEGVRVELQGPDGRKETVVFPKDKNIVQALSSAGLRKNMQVTAETDKSKIAQKITVVS